MHEIPSPAEQAHEPFRIGPDQRLREGIGLRQEEPVPICHGKSGVGARVVLKRRQDVEHRNLLHPLRMVSAIR